MSTCIKPIALFITVSVIFFGCKKKVNEFYDPPANLEPPIYQKLQSKGKFTSFLSLIDKGGYKQVLNTAGYWTIFAPTDSAFQNDTEFAAWLQSRNISNINAIDSASAQSIVQYLLVFNGFNQDRLDDYQSNLGWINNSAFKRRTAYYTGFYNDTSATGQATQFLPRASTPQSRTCRLRSAPSPRSSSPISMHGICGTSCNTRRA